MSTTKKKTPIKAKKPSTKKAAKPKAYKFDHKASKGKARVHIIVTVDQDGKVGTYRVESLDDLDFAIVQALDVADSNGDHAYDVYHIDQIFAVPKRIVKKAKKTRAKKIKTERPEPVTEAVVSHGEGPTADEF